MLLPPILREINPEYSLEGLMLKLKLQYFGQLMQTLENSLMLGKAESILLAAAPDIGRGVAPLAHRPGPRTWGSSSWLFY